MASHDLDTIKVTEHRSDFLEQGFVGLTTNGFAMAIGIDQRLNDRFSLKAQTKIYDEVVELNLEPCNATEPVTQEINQAINLDTGYDKYPTLLCFQNTTDLMLFANRKHSKYSLIELEITLVCTNCGPIDEN